MSGNSGQRWAGDWGSRELQNAEAPYRTRVTKRQREAHSAYKGQRGKLTEAFGARPRPRGAESRVESFEDSSCLAILLRTSDGRRGKGRRRAFPSRGMGNKERQQGAVCRWPKRQVEAGLESR